MEDRVPSCITNVFRFLSALFLWIQSVCEGLYIQTLRQFVWGFVYPYIDGLLVVCTVSGGCVIVMMALVERSTVFTTLIMRMCACVCVCVCILMI